MAYRSYAEGIKNATDLASKAVTTEASVSLLSPLVSPLPTLQKAFPLYISAAEAYSHLVSSTLVPEPDRAAVKKKWRLVLERAEKVRKRIEELGGYVGKAPVSDEGEEEVIKRRGGNLNGLELDFWSNPPERQFSGEKYREDEQPELAKEQEDLRPVWKEVSPHSWEVEMKKDERWFVRQGPGADCSVVAGFEACLEYNRRWGQNLAVSNLWPQAVTGQPKHAENGKHIVKLLLNGAWRGVVIDSLLPKAEDTGAPLHSITRRLPTSLAAPSPSASYPLPSSGIEVGPAWIPLILKGYFKAHGGYSLRGSNPAPDIYSLTGWIPERLNLRDDFQREKEWSRIYTAWRKGEVLVTLGTGPRSKTKRTSTDRELIPLHAFAVLDLTEEDGERMLEVYDPGIAKPHTESGTLEDSLADMKIGHNPHDSPTINTGLFKMTWDAVCGEFETLNLNWSPNTMLQVAKRHWSWPKPNDTTSPSANPYCSARYQLDLNSASEQPYEIQILLSQHMKSKDRPLDDIALHVSDEMRYSGTSTKRTNGSADHQMILNSSPFTNAVHVLTRYTVRRKQATLTVLPLRDRGVYRTDFTIQVFAPDHTTVNLNRITNSLPFSTSLEGALTLKNSGGHAGLPSWIDNPQYKLTLSTNPAGRGGQMTKGELRVVVSGTTEIPWNTKLLWGNGSQVFDFGEDTVMADSGAYSFGLAHLNLTTVDAGSYTLSVSSFEPLMKGKFTIHIESSLPVSLSPLPAEGAGMFCRTISGIWTQENAGGRPSAGQYGTNPKIEVTLPRDCVIMSRVVLPIAPSMPVPLNLTLFTRGPGAQLADQIATSGPYADPISGVKVDRTRVKAGVYVLVPSTWERGMAVGSKWEVKVWSDGPLEVEVV